jgi:hypothetical protein
MERHVSRRGFLAGLLGVFLVLAGVTAPVERADAAISASSTVCVACHQALTPSIHGQWQKSAHFTHDVGCYECHKANPGDVDAMSHNGYLVSIIVSPLDCKQCHEAIVNESSGSHHARGGQILDSLDNVLGEQVEGPAAARMGCAACHGSKVEVLPGGKLDPKTWPNMGIGRINPDGSWGTCSACHFRHEFSRAQARRPENCGRCHLGPDHPQKEIYEESAHGIAFNAHEDEMNLDSGSWVVGVDYTAAPTCATCHMSAAQGLQKTHDVSLRNTWNLKAKVSTRRTNWEQNKARMKQVCGACHAGDYVDGWYENFDEAVDLYNTKFAQPATNIMTALRNAGKLTPKDFDDKIEWTYYLLWHHEGRRARHGASMQGPDYVQWNGFFEIAKNFYTDFIPQAEALLPGVADTVLSATEHQWYQGGGLSKEDLRSDINRDGKVNANDMVEISTDWQKDNPAANNSKDN